MYSKQNIINRKKAQNNYFEEIKKVSNNINSLQKVYQKNYLTYRGEDNRSFNDDYLKEYYQNRKKIKNNENKYYIKKTLKIANDRTHEQHMANYKNNYLESISQGRIKKKKNLIYTLNPQTSNSNSPSKINEFDYSINLSKGNLLESLNNYNYNISGYNTINNVGIQIKLDNNTCNINSNNNLKKSVTFGINKYDYISKPDNNYNFNYNTTNKIYAKKDKLRKNYLHKSSPDLNKFLTLLNDNNNLYTKDKYYLETFNEKNQLTLNTKTNNIINYENLYTSLNTEFDINKMKRKRMKSNKKNIIKIKREVQYRKNEFEKMRTIEKKIKKYFVENGVSYKNRELYHQSAIIIQSNFRAFFTKKNVKLFLKFRGGINVLINIFNNKKKIFFQNFVNNLKKCLKNYACVDLDNNMTPKNYIKKRLVKLIVENSNNFSIINKGENNIKLIEKLEKENQILKNKLNDLESEIKRLKKENELSKIKENSIIKNIPTNNEMNINKIKENIENVSKELEQTNFKNKKNDILSTSPNLKNYININNKNFIRPNTIFKIIDNNNKDINDFKQLFLKYLISLRITKTNERKKFNFYKLKTNIKIN